jgi:excisionase family DNA binding protein
MQSKQKNADEFLTVDEAARLAGLSHWTIRLWLHKRRLTRFKSASRTVVKRSELLELLKPKKAEQEVKD